MAWTNVNIHKPLPITFSFGTTLICCVLVVKNTGTYKVALFYSYGSIVKVCVSETTGPTEAKFHVPPLWDRGKDGKLIQMI